MEPPGVAPRPVPRRIEEYPFTGELYADRHMRGTMSVLTAFGLMLDLIGAVFITVSDPLRFPSRFLEPVTGLIGITHQFRWLKKDIGR